MKKKLVALLTNNDDDIYCFRKELIEALLADGYEVLISCPYGEKFELMEGIEYIYDNPEIDRRGTNVMKDSKLMRHYSQLFKRYHPDIVLTYTAKPNVYGSIAANRQNIPVINNLTGIGSVKNQSKPKKEFIFRLFKHAYGKSACVMFQNETNMKNALAMGLVKGDYMLIPGSGVNTERYPLQAYPEGGNGIHGDPVVFNYIGRILRDKGVDDYIAAAKRIKKKYPATEFNLLGFIEPEERHYEQDLETRARRGIVYYLGSQKHVIPFIARSHATIHPSVYGEGMSNVLLESASSGRPIITTDNPGCKETLQDGRTGFIYEGGNVAQLCACIERFLKMKNKDRQRMGVRGREYVEANFSRTIVIDAYLKKIAEILDK